MSIQTSSAVWHLGKQVTHAFAGEALVQARRCLDESGPVTIDCSQMRRIDTAGMQLVVAFVAGARALSREPDWQGDVSGICVAARQLGIENAQLALPAADEDDD